MKGYKGFEPGLICRGKQYAENTVFEEEEAEICSYGMHFCENPFDVLDYYGFTNDTGDFNEFAEVEALDEVKTNKKSNKIKNPNVLKIAQYQPYKDMFGVVLLTNAEKVILDKIKVSANQMYFDFETSDVGYRIANELRDTIGKIPNKAIFIDEIHHVASEDIKLHQVVSQWTINRNVCEVVGFSGTPYLDSKEKIKISNSLSIENEDISNTIYYYPLVKGIDNFLKKPKIVASSDNNSLNIIKEGLDEFFKKYKDVTYDGLTSKIAIYSGKIETLEEYVLSLIHISEPTRRS